ncbi:MAG TPA: hypothetical protein VE844_19065 [Gammaproteobacteria bacterium]|nr:hypothetical protein [Gammaproteobacteria bacterium]
MLIPPFEQSLASYTVTTPASGFSTNFINIVAPAAAVGAITLDGTEHISHVLEAATRNGEQFVIEASPHAGASL